MIKNVTSFTAIRNMMPIEKFKVLDMGHETYGQLSR